MGTQYEPWIWPGKTPAKREDFAAMTPREADAFCRELVERIPERERELERYVRSTRGFGDWKANHTKKSLGPLGRWLLKVLKIRKPTDEQRMPKLIGTLPKGVELSHLWWAGPHWVFADESYAPLVDVGIYFAETLRLKNPKWHWRRCAGGRGNLVYNQPILAYANRNSTGFSPFNIPFNAAGQMIDGETKPDSLTDLLDIWREGGR